MQIVKQAKNIAQTPLATTKASWNEMPLQLNSKIGKSVLNLISERFKATYQSTREMDESRSKMIFESTICSCLDDCDKGLIKGLESVFEKELFKTVFEPVMKGLYLFNKPENQRKEVLLKVGSKKDTTKFYVEARGNDDVAFTYSTPRLRDRGTLITTEELVDTSSDNEQNQPSADRDPVQPPAVTDQQMLALQHQLREQLILKDLIQKQRESEQGRQLPQSPKVSQLPKVSAQPVNQTAQQQPELSKPLFQPEQPLNPKQKVQEQSSSVPTKVQKAGSEQSLVIQQKQQPVSGQRSSDLSPGYQPPILPRSSSSQRAQNGPIPQPLTAQHVPSSGYPPNHQQASSLPSQAPQQSLYSPAPLNLQPGYPSPNQVQMTPQIPQQYYVQMPLNQAQYNLPPGYPPSNQVQMSSQMPQQYYVQMPFNQVQPALQQVPIQYMQPPHTQPYYIVPQPGMYQPQNQVPLGQQQPIQYVQNQTGQIHGATQPDNGSQF